MDGVCDVFSLLIRFVEPSGPGEGDRSRVRVIGLLSAAELVQRVEEKKF